MQIINRVNQAINAIKNGEMVIMIDDENRENEADIVYAGEFSTPQKINFILKEARGILCTSITSNLAKKLKLSPMVIDNNSNHETAFTISIDARNAKTGVSSYERDLTIKLLCNNKPKEKDFVRPGHIFPLIAKDGGILERMGHTEASIELCKLANLKPIAVICELMKEDGSMAGNNDKFITNFANKHKLKILYVSDLIHYKIQNEKLISIKKEKEIKLFGVSCIYTNFIDILNTKHLVYRFKKNNNFIKLDFVNDMFNILDNKNIESLIKSIEFLKENGGYLIFINSNKKIENEIKDIGIAIQILKHFNIEKFELLITNNNDKSKKINEFGFVFKENKLR